MESLHKRLTYLTSRKIVSVSDWAKLVGMKETSASNKAKRQTIPAFRLRGDWVIAEDYRENTQNFFGIHAKFEVNEVSAEYRRAR
jgi:hypothetical protein